MKWRLCCISDCTNTVTVPTAGRDKTEQLRRKSRLQEQGNTAKQKQDCLQSKSPNTGKALEGTGQSCHLVTSTFSHSCLCCSGAFILLCYSKNHHRELQLQLQGSSTAISVQLSEVNCQTRFPSPMHSLCKTLWLPSI